MASYPDPDRGMARSEPVVSAFVAALPKTELHLHLVGSASAATVAELGRRHPEVDLPATPADYATFCTFDDFSEFLDAYMYINAAVRTPGDIHLLVLGLARHTRASNVRYAEVTVTPTSHFSSGISAAALANALADGRDEALRRFGIHLGWIVDISGQLGLRAAWDVVEFAVEHRSAGIVALGLAGLESGVGRAQFAPHFGRAREAGLPAVVHAGDTTGPATIWSAIRDLNAVRIGHATSAVRDPELLDYLATSGVTVEVCPTSNFVTRTVPDITAHPLPEMIEHGLDVTLSTNNPGMFGTTLNREYALVAEVLGLTEANLADLARAGVKGALCDEPLQQRLLAEIDHATGGDHVSDSSTPAG